MTKWEDQGQHIIDSILKSDDALKELEKTQTRVTDDAAKFDGSGMTAFKQAIEDLLLALDPLLKILADVVGMLARFVSDNPQLIIFIAGVATAIGTLVGWFKIILPFAKQVVDVFKIVGGVFARFAPGVAGGPIFAIIAGITLLVGIVKTIKDNWGPLSKFFSGLWDGIVSIFKRSLKFFTDDIPRIFTSVVEGIIKAFKKLPDGIKNIFNGILNILKIPINNMIKLLNLFLKGINKIKIPEWVPKVGGKGFEIPEIPMLAKGTSYFKGGRAIVGEQGPELVEMPTGAKVNNASKTADMLNGNGGTIITGNNFNIREEADVVKVARQLYIFQKQGDRGKSNR